VATQIETKRFNYQFNVEGMTCAACVANVEKALNTVPGVLEIAVNLATESAQITSSEPVPLDRLTKSVTKMGYRLEPQGSTSLIDRQQRNIKNWGRLLGIQMIFGVPLLIYAMLEMFNIIHAVPLNLNILIQLVLASIMVITGAGYYQRGIKHLILLVPNMDSLVALGTGSAYIYSLISSANLTFHLGFTGFETLYFEAAGTILMFITLGKWLEALAKGKTTEALTGLMEQMPKEAQVWRDESWQTVPLAEVLTGDRVKVLPHQRIPVDGVILKGSSSVDESSISGEALPVEKQIADQVIGTSMNLHSVLEIKATAVGRDSIFGQIIKLVEDAQSKKPEIQRLVDKIAAVFVPVVLLLAILAGATWLLLGYGITFALNVMISVMIIACPCALGLATPTALVVASGIAARSGILIKSADAFQQLSRMTTMVFDKTGTLTKGEVQFVDQFPEKAPDLVPLALGLEIESQHPLAKALARFGGESGLSPRDMTDIQETPGEGISGSSSGVRINLRKLLDKDVMGDDFKSKLEQWLGQGYTVSGIFQDDILEGMIAFSDTLKPESAQVISRLKHLGLSVVLATGDRSAAAQEVGRITGISDIHAEVLPADKHRIIQELQAKGEIVGMIGDGINDAPALASADIGLSFQGGTDIALNAADIIFMNGSLENLVISRRLAESTLVKIKQNLFWAFIYNLVGIPVAMGVFYSFTGMLLNPMFAGMAMAFSSVSVVTNTLLLRRKNFQK